MLMLTNVVMALALASSTSGGAGERWTAVSKTAMSITGDVTLRSDRIVFSNGVVLPLRKVRTVAFTDDTGFTGRGTLYRVPNPVDPVLLHGNRMCGATRAVPVTFVVVWKSKPLPSGGGDGRAFAAYSTSMEPPPSVQRACGVFRYEVAQ